MDNAALRACKTELGRLLVAVVAGDVPLEPLEEYLDGFSADELDVLGFVASRLRLGRATYGSLDVALDGRDLVEEAREEAADMLIYLAAHWLGVTASPASRVVSGRTTRPALSVVRGDEGA